MIETINAPNNVAAFRATGEVTKEDYKEVIIPAVEELVKNQNKLNFLLLLDTEIGNFTLGAWVQDVMLGLENFGKWHRAAIVSDSDSILAFTDGFSYISPGEFRGFKKDDLNDAINWVGGN